MILPDRCVIRITYHRDVKLRNGTTRAKITEFPSYGYTCATKPSSATFDSFFYPDRAIAIFTEKGAKRILKDLTKDWEHYLHWSLTEHLTRNSRRATPVDVKPHMPIIEILPVSIELK